MAILLSLIIGFVIGLVTAATWADINPTTREEIDAKIELAQLKMVENKRKRAHQRLLTKMNNATYPTKYL